MKIADLRAHAHLFDDYTELRVQQNRNVGLTMINGDLVRNARSVQGGVSARVARAGGWGFCSTPEIDGAALERVVGRASANAKVLAERSKLPDLQLPATKGNGSYDWESNAKERSQKELIEFLGAIDAHIKETYPKLSSRQVAISNLDMQKTLLTSQGAEAFSMTPRSLLYIRMTMEAGGEPIELLNPLGGLGHFADRFETPARSSLPSPSSTNTWKPKPTGSTPKRAPKLVSWTRNWLASWPTKRSGTPPKPISSWEGPSRDSSWTNKSPIP